jgi:hypothetical protein
MSSRSHPVLPTALLSLAVLALAAFGADAPAAPAVPTKSDTPAAITQPADLKAPTPATPENAAAYLGGWNLALEGPNGAAAMKITLKSEAGKVTGELSSEMMETQKFAEVIRSGTGLIMRYSFDYQGMAIDAEAKLTPAGEKMNASVSFAGGAFVMDGTATKQAAK